MTRDKAKCKIREEREKRGLTQVQQFADEIGEIKFTEIGDAKHGRLKNPEKIASLSRYRATLAATERGGIHARWYPRLLYDAPMIGDLVKLRVSVYPGLPDDVRHIVLTNSVIMECEGDHCAYTIKRHHAEEVQGIMAARVGASSAEEVAIREGVA